MRANNRNRNDILTNNIERAPNQVLKWRIAFLVACAIGICLSIDLLRLHVIVYTDPDYHSYCAISERVNCETVAQSKYAIFLGTPVAVWGIIFYLFQGTLCVWGLRRPFKPLTWPFALSFWISSVAVLTSIILFLVSHFLVKSLCIVCMCTYIVNSCILIFSYIEIRQLKNKIIDATLNELKSISHRLYSFGIISIIFLALIILLPIFFPKYWEEQTSIGIEGIPIGFTLEEQHPWIGNPDAKITIMEFSDYQCPYCSRGHYELRNFVKKYPTSFKLIHRNYPLDINCNKDLSSQLHPFACLYAKMAYCASKMNKFWEVNDYLYANGKRHKPVTLYEISAAFSLNLEKMQNCIESSEASQAIQKDIEYAKLLHIRGTPTYVVNGKIYPGYIPRDVLGLPNNEINQP